MAKKEEYPLKEGINEYVTNEYYHNNRTYKSSSVLKEILKNPRNYYYKYILGEETDSKINMNSMNLGSYVHGLILEPHLIEVEFAVFEGKRKAGKEWEIFKELHKGKTIITTSQKRVADRMIEQYHKSSIILGNNEEETKISSFYEEGVAEETFCCELGGIKIKTRFDYRKKGKGFHSINDVKTTYKDMKWVQKREIEEICKDYSYDISAALYVDSVEKVTGSRPDFFFTFISTTDYHVRHVKASEQMLSEGRRKYKEAIRLIKLGDETGIYYSNEIEEIDSI